MPASRLWKREAGKPAWVEIHQKMSNFSAKLVQNRVKYADSWLWYIAAWSPLQYIYGQHSIDPAEGLASKYDLVGVFVWAFRSSPYVTTQAIRQTTSCLRQLHTIKSPKCMKNPIILPLLTILYTPSLTMMPGLAWVWKAVRDGRI
jgi:hypothetical protein